MKIVRNSTPIEGIQRGAKYRRIEFDDHNPPELAKWVVTVAIAAMVFAAFYAAAVLRWGL